LRPAGRVAEFGSLRRFTNQMIEKVETVLRAIATVIAIPLIAVLSLILFLALLLLQD